MVEWNEVEEWGLQYIWTEEDGADWSATLLNGLIPMVMALVINSSDQVHTWMTPDNVPQRFQCCTVTSDDDGCILTTGQRSTTVRIVEVCSWITVRRFGAIPHLHSLVDGVLQQLYHIMDVKTLTATVGMINRRFPSRPNTINRQ